MLEYPNIDPVAVHLGPLKVHWYGLMYLVGFAAGWLLGRRRASRPGSGFTAAQVDDMVFLIIVGLVLGGRIGYILFYNFSAFLGDPLMLFRVWEGGMSFHGGLIGGALGALLFCRKTGKSFFEVGDFVCPLVPIGLGAGRIGNFINAELWGKPTDLPWGMVFPYAGLQPRHPSQLYEAFLEGVVLFVVLWLYSARPRPRMAVSGMFLAFYGLFRFLVELVRQPDSHIGYLAFGWVTMGQLLSLPMILLGAGLVVWAYRREKSASGGWGN